MADKPLLAKLLLKPGVTLAIVGAPRDQKPPAGAKVIARGAAEALLVYAASAAALEKSWPKAQARLGDDTRVWIAYPKAGKLDTDLNRDVLFKLMQAHGYDAVRQVAIDDTWSAMWFKAV